MRSRKGAHTSSPWVTFLAPPGGRIPVGGFRIVYEYANRLVARGWRIRIVQPQQLTAAQIRRARSSMMLRLSSRWEFERDRWHRAYLPGGWFNLDPRVDYRWVRTPHPARMPVSDIWIATWWYTAFWVARYSGIPLYLIQGLESYVGPEHAVLETWRLPLRKIVIARWLEDYAATLGEPVDYIPNGLDFDEFGMDVSPEQRAEPVVGMLCHADGWKGTVDGVSALRQVKAALPELKAIMFGVNDRPEYIPAWIEYHRKPSRDKLRQLYNKMCVFVSPSHTEGFPLPPAEAIQCGCALAATDIGGHREFATHGETALLSPAGDTAMLAKHVEELLRNETLRVCLAHSGHAHIQQFTWDRAVSSFESVLEDALAGRSDRHAV